VWVLAMPMSADQLGNGATRLRAGGWDGPSKAGAGVGFRGHHDTFEGVGKEFRTARTTGAPLCRAVTSRSRPSGSLADVSISSTCRNRGLWFSGWAPRRCRGPATFDKLTAISFLLYLKEGRRAHSGVSTRSSPNLDVRLLRPSPGSLREKTGHFPSHYGPFSRDGLVEKKKVLRWEQNHSWSYKYTYGETHQKAAASAVLRLLLGLLIGWPWQHQGSPSRFPHCRCRLRGKSGASPSSTARRHQAATRRRARRTPSSALASVLLGSTPRAPSRRRKGHRSQWPPPAALTGVLPPARRCTRSRDRVGNGGGRENRRRDHGEETEASGKRGHDLTDPRRQGQGGWTRGLRARLAS